MSNEMAKQIGAAILDAMWSPNSVTMASGVEAMKIAMGRIAIEAMEELFEITPKIGSIAASDTPPLI